MSSHLKLFIIGLALMVSMDLVYAYADTSPIWIFLLTEIPYYIGLALFVRAFTLAIEEK